jgi:hypothetical protein
MPPVYPAGSYPAKVVADGATSYWRLNETSGTTAVDVIGGANGTISGGVTLGQPGALAESDKAMAFNGTTGKILLTPATGLIAPQFTIEAWAKMSSAHDGHVFCKSIGGATQSCWSLFHWGGSYYFRVVTADAQLHDIAWGSAPLNQWLHFVGTHDGTTARLYVNGAEVGNTPAGANRTGQGAGDAYIGIAEDGSGYPWLGVLDEVAFYQTALTAAQVSAHYAARLVVVSSYPPGSYPDKVVTDGAAAYWRLGETSGTTAVDAIGGNNGTITGGVTLNQAGAISGGDTAMVFNGTTGYISVPSSAAITPTGSFTVETWVKTLTATEVPLVEKFDAGNAGFMFSLNNFGGGNYYALWVGNGWVEGPGVVADGQWHHLVGVWNGTTVSLYLDGAVRRSIAPTGVNLPATTHALEIARRYDISVYSNASLDEVAFYSTALTAPQIAAHYAARTYGALCAPFLWLEDVDMPKYNLWTPITPSDSADLLRVTDGIWVGGAGNVAAVMQNNTVPTNLVVPAGAWLPIVARRINATGTTATGLVALNSV